MAAPLDLEQRIGAGRLRLVESTRALVETVAGVGTDVDDDALAGAAAAVEAAMTALADAGVSPSAGRPWSGRYGDFLPRSLLVGRAHPLSPAATYTVTDGVLEVQVRFGSVYEGPPGCVHGGIVALAFDELFGMCNVVNGQGGLTGRLSVRYRTPTPLHRTLRMTARPVHREGRRMRLHGTVHADDVLTAEAEGLFVVPRRSLRDGPARDT